MKKEISIVFMGTPGFAVEILRSIHQSGFSIPAVITAPDRPAGRGKKIHLSAVKEYALRHNLKILQPTNLKDPAFIQELKDLKPDIQVVVAFRMLPKAVWEIPPMGTFNLHASLLPQYRGAAPINWALINGETQTGVTTFLIDEKIDTGAILFQEKLNILATDDFGKLHDKLMKLGAKLVIRTIDSISKGEINPIIQTNNQELKLKPAPKIFKEDTLINWMESGIKIHNLIRGLSPYPGAFSFLTRPDGKRMSFKIFQSGLTLKTGAKNKKSIPKIVLENKKSFKIELKDSYLIPEIIQLEGRKRMPVEDFLKGIDNFEQWMIDNNKNNSQ
jgi:methionyl-tRNA formyltransferase